MKWFLLLLALLLPAEALAARLVTSGFETGTNTSGVENQLETSVTSAFTVQNTTKRSGNYAAKFLPSSTNGYATFLHTALTTGGVIYTRFYLNITTNPATDTYIYRGAIANGNPYYYIKLTTDGKLRLTDGVNTYGDTSALSTGTWYRVEVSYTHASGAVEAKLEGTTFGTGSTTTSKAIDRFVVGSIDSPASGEWYIDDVAANDNTGSYQTSWPGDGKIIHLLADGVGANNQWTAVGSANGCSSSARYNCVNEIPPDGTTYLQMNVANYVTDLTLSSTSFSGTINVVHGAWRFIRSSTSPPSAQLIVNDGTNSTAGPSTAPLSSWFTNTTSTPRLFPVTLYQTPSNTTWTTAILDGTYLTLKCLGTATSTFRVTNAWLVVDYTPEASQTLTGSIGAVASLDSSPIPAYPQTGSIGALASLASSSSTSEGTPSAELVGSLGVIGKLQSSPYVTYPVTGSIGGLMKVTSSVLKSGAKTGDIGLIAQTIGSSISVTYTQTGSIGIIGKLSYEEIRYASKTGDIGGIANISSASTATAEQSGDIGILTKLQSGIDYLADTISEMVGNIGTVSNISSTRSVTYSPPTSIGAVARLSAIKSAKATQTGDIGIIESTNGEFLYTEEQTGDIGGVASIYSSPFATQAMTGSFGILAKLNSSFSTAGVSMFEQVGSMGMLMGLSSIRYLAAAKLGDLGAIIKTSITYSVTYTWIGDLGASCDLDSPSSLAVIFTGKIGGICRFLSPMTRFPLAPKGLLFERNFNRGIERGVL